VIYVEFVPTAHDLQSLALDDSEREWLAVRLNELRRQIERSPIVDNCAIVTANRDVRRANQVGVWARFIIYLQRPEGELTAEDVAIEGNEKKSFFDDMKKVTQFVGGDVSQP
jgi:hypothetical protein